VDDGLVETRRGLGMFINAGARSLLLQGERQKFLAKNGPESTQPFSGSDLKRKNYSRMAQAAKRRQRLSRKLKKRRRLTMACIEARVFRKAFGTTVALDGVDLRVEEGRILGIIGPNGAGRRLRSTRFSASPPIKEN